MSDFPMKWATNNPVEVLEFVIQTIIRFGMLDPDFRMSDNARNECLSIINRAMMRHESAETIQANVTGYITGYCRGKVEGL